VTNNPSGICSLYFQPLLPYSADYEMVFMLEWLLIRKALLATMEVPAELVYESPPALVTEVAVPCI